MNISVDDKGATVRTDDTMTTTADQTVAELGALLADLLGGPAERFGPETELFGSLPELDSLALVELITVIEDHFGFAMDEDDITAEVFGTVESLARHIDAHR